MGGLVMRVVMDGRERSGVEGRMHRPKEKPHALLKLREQPHTKKVNY